MNDQDAKSIVIVGGGAGGLELVVQLARKLRRRRGDSVERKVVLIDRDASHIWKPLLHEVATGSLNSYHDESSYRMLARKHGFEFILGEATRVDTDTRRVELAPVTDERGREMVAAREVAFDQLVLAAGSLSNDFETHGVAEHCLMLDSRAQAERFHRRFINELHRVNAMDDESRALSVLIVGGGATGVELAADLHNVAERLTEFGFDEFSADRLKVQVIEASERLLPQLPERIGRNVKQELESIGVEVRIDTMVDAAESNALVTASGRRLPADISVWAAGIRAPDFIEASGFSTDRLGRVEVTRDLRIDGQRGLFAIGDCCACPMDDEGTVVPPRAQSAHQMARVALRNLLAEQDDQALKDFEYRDFGSLISLSSYSTVGNLMGNLMKGSVFIEGWLARRFYLSLYRMHQVAVHGRLSTLLIMLGDRIYKATRADLKLH